MGQTAEPISQSDHLRRLVAIAYDRTEHMNDDVSAFHLLADASHAALRIPEPLGSAIAAVLALAAAKREARAYDGLVTESRGLLALALVALEYDPVRPLPTDCQ